MALSTKMGFLRLPNRYLENYLYNYDILCIKPLSTLYIIKFEN